MGRRLGCCLSVLAQQNSPPSLALFPCLNNTVLTNTRQTSTCQVNPHTRCSGGPSTSSRHRRTGRQLRRLARSGAARPNSAGSTDASEAAARRRRSRGHLSHPSLSRQLSRRYSIRLFMFRCICAGLLFQAPPSVEKRGIMLPHNADRCARPRTHGTHGNPRPSRWRTRSIATGATATRWVVLAN